MNKYNWQDMADKAVAEAIAFFHELLQDGIAVEAAKEIILRQTTHVKAVRYVNDYK